VSIPAAFVRIVGASSTRGWLPLRPADAGEAPPCGVAGLRDPGDINRKIEDTLIARSADRGTMSLP
jgi:hypothetical protein